MERVLIKEGGELSAAISGGASQRAAIVQYSSLYLIHGLISMQAKYHSGSYAQYIGLLKPMNVDSGGI